MTGRFFAIFGLSLMVLPFLVVNYLVGFRLFLVLILIAVLDIFYKGISIQDNQRKITFEIKGDFKNES